MGLTSQERILQAPQRIHISKYTSISIKKQQASCWHLMQFSPFLSKAKFMKDANKLTATEV